MPVRPRRGAATSTTPAAPHALRCEHLQDPIGLDEPRPRLSWKLPPDDRGTAQTAYRILVAATAHALGAGRGDVWDSGRVDASEAHLVEYAGPPVAPHTRYWWAVRFWNEHGAESPWSAPACFETGFLGRAWPAQWIGLRQGRTQEPHPARFLRAALALDELPRAARLYVAARGLFEPYVNGARVGRDRLVPGWTDYRRRVEYLTYDVTRHLRAGRNAVGAILADGWYAGHLGFQGRRQHYGDQPALLAVLRCEMPDGAIQEFGTGSGWRVATGPILLADLYDGETHDARKARPGWAAPDGDDRRWRRAAVLDVPPVELNGKAVPPVRAVAELRPVRVTEPRRGRFVFDLGQNMVGAVRLRVNARRGTRFVLRHGEMLDARGTVYTANLRRARAIDEYTCAGGGAETFEPRFTFHGFRYVEITGFTRRPRADAVAGVVLSTDLPWTGTFECSDPLVTRLQRNIQWSQRGNYLDVPTDCPQRDERLGWTGDAQVFAPTGSFNADTAAFFAKWLRDLADAQADSGAFPDVAPDLLGMMAGGGASRPGNAAWADAGVICPWVVYERHGDRRVLEACYPSMLRWIACQETGSRDLVRPETAFGDWLAVDAVSPQRAPTPSDLIGTAYFARTAGITARAAEVLGRLGDAARLHALHGRIVAAFNREFVTPGGRVAGDTQTAYLLALAFDLLPEAQRPPAFDRLVHLVAKAGFHLTTGFVGTPLLCPVLSRFGRHDLAYRLLRQTSYPGWLFPVVNGATTMWERWNGWTPDGGFADAGMNSFNHYAYGAIGEWLYTVVAGIDVDPAAPGYRRFRLAPHPGGGLTWARASYESPAGRIESAWRIRRGRLEWSATVPPNTTATARLPARRAGHVTERGTSLESAPGVVLQGEGNGVTLRLAPGSYRFVVRDPDLVPETTRPLGPDLTRPARRRR
jgi:alpha-L-rhamnosidase